MKLLFAPLLCALFCKVFVAANEIEAEKISEKITTNLPARPMFSISIERVHGEVQPKVEEKTLQTEVQKIRQELISTSLYIQKKAHLDQLEETLKSLQSKIKNKGCFDLHQVMTGDFILLGSEVESQVCTLFALQQVQNQLQYNTRQFRVVFRDLMQRMNDTSPEEYLDTLASRLTEALRVQGAPSNEKEGPEVDSNKNTREIFVIIGITLLVCGVLFLALSVVVIYRRAHHARRSTTTTISIPLSSTLDKNLMKN